MNQNAACNIKRSKNRKEKEDREYTEREEELEERRQRRRIKRKGNTLVFHCMITHYYIIIFIELHKA